MRVFIGYDRGENSAAQVAKASLLKHASRPVEVTFLKIDMLRLAGLYTRQAWKDGAQRYDTNDEKPFSTEFSFSRFLVPALCQWEGWALFCDSDIMFRSDVYDLFRSYADDSFYALRCVQHDYRPKETQKMRGGLEQTPYFRKNWSSVMLFNCSHMANRVLTPHLVNVQSGRYLQQLSWLPDDLIGSMDPEWNWLDGHSDPTMDPRIVHFTRGTPDVPGYTETPFGDEWWAFYGALSDAA